MLAQLLNVEKFYGDTDILRGINLRVFAGDRFALAGRNGAGKSTLLKILSGLEEASSGQVELAPGLSLCLLRQDPDFSALGTVIEAVESAFTEFDALEKKMRDLEPQLENETAQHEYHELEEHYRLRGGYSRNSRRDAVLTALGFLGREQDKLSALSGGERTRLALAQALVAQPELLLLDEPTNHLDIVMIEWLEGFLRNYPGAILMVSHDRAFLDATTTRTALLERGELQIFEGNYSAFQKKYAAMREVQAKRAHNDAREQKRLADAAEQMRIWGFRNEKLAIRARGMLKRVERFEEQMTDTPDEALAVSRVNFPAPESAEVVMVAESLSKSFAKRNLFTNINLHVRRGERIAIVGRNGTGKTTLLKMLVGLVASDDARAKVHLGSRVRAGYYDQQLRGVDETNSLYNEVRNLVSLDQEAYDLLGAYLFPYDQIERPVSQLSGGERARLALLKLAKQECNLLILDEPTNHLDMEMLETLEKALTAFTGTLIMVSHDRSFIEKLANKIWLLEDGKFYEYPGGWNYYLQKHDGKQQEENVANQPVNITGSNEKNPEIKNSKNKKLNPWKLREQQKRLEAEIATLETEHQELLVALANPNPGADFAALGKRSGEIELLLKQKMMTWEETASQLQE